MKLLLVIELDNTLAGNYRAIDALNQRLACIRNQIHLVYITGRSYTSSRQLIAQAKILKPDYLITSVGSEIYQQGVLLEKDWANYISQDWKRDEVAVVASYFSVLKAQPDIEQTPWKLSFCLDMSASLEVITDLQDLLTFMELQAQVIFSNGRDIDIIPKSSNKGKAVGYLQHLLKVDPTATIVCGGSGNDMSLFQLPSPGIIVGNAQTEIIWWYYNTCYPWHYLTHYPDATGILEGLIYFNVLPFPNNWRQPIPN
ncbi:sucrose-phosphate phosphatase [Nostoc spongiaeforme FACHB-130]|uniref:sucrose-phosphate phosphatase n=1 Tax=Nostoc spongiaeforme FACHB-130 TaxID=1357510 RepID=A0ABR8FR08_9NOSO|nr:sucrose-phosphate phosphatase [Nostoc spongiaeforme]MBD2593589.1 sucrose-phosphate phosphatase [Nostoc spongiaeforme FACHB-130]